MTAALNHHGATRIAVVLASTALLAVAAIAVPQGATAASGALQPGQYRVTSVIAGQSTPTTRLECHSAETIAQLFALPPGEGKCSTTRNVTANGRIDIARSCAGPRGATTGSIVGTYTPASFTVRTVMRSPALPGPLDVRMSGQRTTATCTGD